MSYAISVPASHFSREIREKRATARRAMRGALTFLIWAATPKEDVFIALERFDAEITARDNKKNELAKLVAIQVTV